MSGSFYGNQFNNSREHIDFDQLFKQQHFNIAKLLDTKDIVDEAKYQNQQITSKLIQNTQILIDLIQISFRPQRFHHPQIDEITTKHTYKAIQILDNLSQQFSQYLMAHESNKNEKNTQDSSIQSNQSIYQPNNVFKHFLQILNDKKPIQETPLAYFSKIATVLCYQKPKQLLDFINRSNYAYKLFDHFYSHSIYELVLRMIQIDCQDGFLIEQKIQIIEKCQKNIIIQKDDQLLMQKLQNYYNLIDNLYQKAADRFDRTKYIEICKLILNNQLSIIFLVKKLQQKQNNKEIVIWILNNVNKYLEFGIDRSHSPLTAVQKMFDQSENQLHQKILMSKSSLKIICQIINKTKKELFLPDTSRIYMQSYLCLIRSMIQIDSFNYDQIADWELIKKMLEFCIQHKNCNIIHNLVKDILILMVKIDPKVVKLLINREEYKMLELAQKMSITNSKFSFQNQIYHIMKAILYEIQHNPEKYQQLADYEILKNKLQAKQKFYTFSVGGNARKISSNWGDYSAEQSMIDKFFSLQNQAQIEHQSKLHQNNWMQCQGLPMDSDSSRQQHHEPNNLSTHKSPLKNETPNTDINQPSYTHENRQMTNKQVQDDFQERFNTYLSYQVEQLLSEMQ